MASGICNDKPRRCESAPDSGRIASLDGLRAFSALGVFFFHLHVFVAAQHPNLFSWFVTRMGPVGTNTLFCLSGYFIYRSLILKSRPYRTFVWLRILRIFPVYLAVLTLYFLWFWAIPAKIALPVETWRMLHHFIVNALLLAPFLRQEPVVEASWALSYIFLFYLICPPVAGLVRRLPRLGRIAVLIAIWALLLAVSLRGGYFPPRVTLLIAGMLLFETMGTSVPSRVIATMIAAGAITRLAGGGIWLLGGFAGSALFALGVCLAGFGGSTVFAHALRWPPLVWLGRRSYSFYLCHGFAVVPLNAFLLPRLQTWEIWAIQPFVLVFAVLLSGAMYQVVERRFHTLQPPAT
jgi:exopolysaccharide production protein ExoZ